MSNNLSPGLWQVINPLTGFSPSPKHTLRVPAFTETVPLCAPFSSPLHACMLSHFSCARLFATLWTIACQDSPDKNTGVGCHFLLQRVFMTQGSNPSLLNLPHWQVGSLPLAPPGDPHFPIKYSKVSQPHTALELKLHLKIPLGYIYSLICNCFWCLPLSSKWQGSWGQKYAVLEQSISSVSQKSQLQIAGFVTLG